MHLLLVSSDAFVTMIYDLSGNPAPTHRIRMKNIALDFRRTGTDRFYGEYEHGWLGLDHVCTSLVWCVCVFGGYDALAITSRGCLFHRVSALSLPLFLCWVMFVGFASCWRLLCRLGD